MKTHRKLIEKSLNKSSKNHKSIIKKSKQLLNENGRIYFEINEQKAVDIKSLLEKNNFDNILIKKDLQGKDRMIKATKKL